MAQGDKKATYDTRYKHKLNMLVPGGWMLLAAAGLFILGLICGMLSWRICRLILFACAAVTALALAVLVGIELHQDRVLNDIAAKEMKRQNGAGPR